MYESTDLIVFRLVSFILKHSNFAANHAYTRIIDKKKLNMQEKPVQLTKPEENQTKPERKQTTIQEQKYLSIILINFST